MNVRVAATLVLLLGASSVQAAEKMYKWTDAQGTVHYSTKPPEGQTDTAELTLQKAPPPPPAAAPAAADQSGADAQAPLVSPSEACKQAQANLKLLEQNSANLVMQQGGETRALSAEQREEQLAANRAIVEQHCQSAQSPPPT